MSKRERYLKAVWDQPNGTSARYVPRALGKGSSWGVYDRQEGKFVEIKDLMRLDIEHVVNAKAAHA